MSFELYPDQKKLVDDLRRSIKAGAKSPLVVLPTGGGKTVIFSWLSAQMRHRGLRVQILSHRQELLAQITSTLQEFDVAHTLCAAGMTYNAREPVCNSSVFTAARRLDKVQVPDVVICDEGHHYIQGSVWDSTIGFWREHNPRLLVIGFTATPERLDGTGLDYAYDAMVEGLSVAELIKIGRLSDYKLFAPKQQLDVSGLHMRAGDYQRGEVEDLMGKPKIVGSAISHYRKYLNGLPSVAFCVSRKHAVQSAEEFRRAGFTAASIEGSMTTRDRREVNRDFKAGRLNLMMSCDLISEGYDVPGMHGELMLRPTASLALAMQQMGRVLRKAPGKEFAYILDHVGNSARHGLPDTPREWSLQGRKKRPRGEVERDIQVRICESCGAASPAGHTACRECGQLFQVDARKIEEVDGELQEVDKEAMARQFVQRRYNARELESLVEVGRMKGMNNPEGWARHVLEYRQKKAAERAGR